MPRCAAFLRVSHIRLGADVICHFWGCVLVTWFIAEDWYYTSFFPIFIFFR